MSKNWSASRSIVLKSSLQAAFWRYLLLKHFRDRPSSLPPSGLRGKWDAEKGEEGKKRKRKGKTRRATTCSASARRTRATAAHTCSHFSRVTRGWLVPTRFRIMPTQLGLLVNSQKMKSHAGHGSENAYLHYRHYRIFTVPLELWNYDTGPPTYSDSAGEKVSL